MLYDFTYCNPCRIHFGKTALDHLPDELALYGPNVLFAYGKNSIKVTGLYDRICKILKDSGKVITEFSGVMPNPTYHKVLEGAELCRRQHIDLILAVGGGSVIDCCKAVSAAAHAEDDFWKLYWEEGKTPGELVIPIGTVLTMVGTGSEMNASSVITHEDKQLKVGHTFDERFIPRFSILDPVLTYTLPEYQMVSGIYDIMQHLMEQYFSGTDDNVSDDLLEAVMRSVIRNAPLALKEPDHYEYRSNIMWAATMALNEMLGLSKEQDWEVHAIEHQIGAFTDCAHGAGLAVVAPSYYRHIYRFGLPKFCRFAREVWDISPEGKTEEELALAGIAALEAFRGSLGLPSSLKELGVTEEMIRPIAESTAPGGAYCRVGADEIEAILRACYA